MLADRVRSARTPVRRVGAVSHCRSVRRVAWSATPAANNASPARRSVRILSAAPRSWLAGRQRLRPRARSREAARLATTMAEGGKRSEAAAHENSKFSWLRAPATTFRHIEPCPGTNLGQSVVEFTSLWVSAVCHGRCRNRARVDKSTTQCSFAIEPPRSGLDVESGAVRLRWSSGGGCPAQNFAVHVGTASGQSSVAVANVASMR